MECQHFVEQLDALTTWVKNTKELLETQGPVGSVTDHDEQDSVVVDPTVSKHEDSLINSIEKLLINTRDYEQTPEKHLHLCNNSSAVNFSASDCKYCGMTPLGCGF